MRPFNSMEGAFQLAYENKQRLGLEECIARLSRGVDSLSEKKRLHRKAKGYLRKLKALALKPDIAIAVALSESIIETFHESLDPLRKVKCGDTKRSGHKSRWPKPTPTGKPKGLLFQKPKRKRGA